MLLPRLRFLNSPSVGLSDSGRTTPWSLRKRPHALQSGVPDWERRQSGVLVVLQLVQMFWAFPAVVKTGLEEDEQSLVSISSLLVIVVEVHVRRDGVGMATKVEGAEGGGEE